MTLLIREADVRRILTMPDAITALETAFREWGNGVAQNAPRQRIVQPRGVLHMLSGSLPLEDALGFKAYTAFPEGVRFVVNLYSASTGELRAIIEADWMGRVRTGAASGLATQYLARQDASVLAIIGAGSQGETQALAVAAVRPLTEIRAFRRDRQQLDAFCTRFAESTGIKVIAAESAEQATRGADIICTMTTARHAVLEGGWLKAGVHINAAGSNWNNRREVDDAVITGAHIIVADSVEQAQLEAGDLIIPASTGKLEWQRVQELSALVAEKIPGRQHPEQITFFKLLGLGLEDVAVAALVYRLAKEQGVGEEIRMFDALSQQ